MRRTLMVVNGVFMNSKMWGIDMGLERYSEFIKSSKGALVFVPGWSEENLTGSWRIHKPIVNPEKCTKCNICWLYCPDGVITKDKIEINYNYCKGCGICAEECPVDAIIMSKE